MTGLLNQLDEQRSPRTRVTVNQLMDRYLELVKIEETTRTTYRGTSVTTFDRFTGIS